MRMYDLTSFSRIQGSVEVKRNDRLRVLFGDAFGVFWGILLYWPDLLTRKNRSSDF